MSQIVQAPCTISDDICQPLLCSLISFRMVLPIHAVTRLPQFEFITLSFFRVQQLVYRDSPHHVEFSHLVHRELSSMLHNAQLPQKGSGRPYTSCTRTWMQKIRVHCSRERRARRQLTTRSQEQLSMATVKPGSSRTLVEKSSFDECHKGHPPSVSSSTYGNLPIKPSIGAPPRVQGKQLFGGIMVSQQIMVDVQEVSFGALAKRLE